MKQSEKICFLVSTFDQREKFLTPFLYFYKKFFTDYSLFICKDFKEFQPYVDLSMENIIQLIYNSNSILNNIDLARHSQWGYRLKNSLNHIRDNFSNFSYVIFLGDDNWIRSIDIEKFSKLYNIMEEYKIDNLRLTQIIDDNSKIKINDKLDLYELEKIYRPWYLSHQTSIWNLNKLNNVVFETDTASISESIGSKRCLQNNYKMCEFGNLVIDSHSIFANNSHFFDENGPNLLRIFCNNFKLDSKEVFKRFIL